MAKNNQIHVDQAMINNVGYQILKEQMEKEFQNIKKDLSEIAKKLQIVQESTTKSEDLKNKLNNKLFTAVTDTSLHGIPRIFNSDTIFQKLIWTITILISLAGCFFIIIKNVTDYYEYPVITNSDRIFEKKPIFPSVLFTQKTYSCKFEAAKAEIQVF